MSKAETYVPLNNVFDEIENVFKDILEIEMPYTEHIQIYSKYKELIEKINNLNGFYAVKIEEEDDLK